MASIRCLVIGPSPPPHRNDGQPARKWSATKQRRLELEYEEDDKRDHEAEQAGRFGERKAEQQVRKLPRSR
jgi:hypothetical protein